MLKVTVELMPGGAEAFRRTIGLMTIGNISDLAELSDYQVSVTEGANPLTGTPPRVRNFVVHGHARRQSVWKLLARAIAEMEGTEPAEL